MEELKMMCVISKDTFNEYGLHDIQTNSAWAKNPYSEGYAIVPDALVQGILATQGYCDIILNDDETEVVSFTARDIPEIVEPEPVEPEPTAEDMLNALAGGIKNG